MGDLIPMNQARERLGVSKNKLRRLIAQHGIELYENPIDAREKLLDFDQLEAKLRPIPIRRRPDEQGKAAA